MFFDEFVF
jgi:hypothetical protein